MAITARATFNGHSLTDIPVINPGDWFGKAWLIEIGGSYTPLFLVVEANSVTYHDSRPRRSEGRLTDRNRT